MKQIGLGDQKKQVRFDACADESSHVCEEGKVVLQIDTIDNLIPSDVQIDMIKMDIEGSEYGVLVGAQERIRNVAPKLANDCSMTKK